MMSPARQNELSLDALRLLRRIHDIGLTHGDPCLNNFGLANTTIFVFDLESEWSLGNPQLHDLITLASDLYVNNGKRMRVFELVAESYGQFEKDRLGPVWSAYYKFRYDLSDKALSFFRKD